MHRYATTTRARRCPNLGLRSRDVSVAYQLIWHYTVGELIDTHHRSDHMYSSTMVRDADPDTYAALAAVVAGQSDAAPSDHFAENLQRILDGLIPRLQA